MATWIAGYGAIVASLVLVWQVFTWRQDRKLGISVDLARTSFDGSWFLVIEVRNLNPTRPAYVVSVGYHVKFGATRPVTLVQDPWASSPWLEGAEAITEHMSGHRRQRRASWTLRNPATRFCRSQPTERWWVTARSGTCPMPMATCQERFVRWIRRSCAFHGNGRTVTGARARSAT